MRSDNGGNFTRGEKQLREAVTEFNQGRIHEFLLAKGVEWIFNPPAGSHFGGVWEQCIRTARKVMKALRKELASRKDPRGVSKPEGWSGSLRQAEN